MRWLLRWLRGDREPEGRTVEVLRLEMPPETKTSIVALSLVAGCSLGATLSRALSLYERVLDEKASGAKVVLERADGSQVELEVP